MNFDQLIQDVLETQSPDLHLQAGQPPMARLKNGSIVAIGQHPAITTEDILQVINRITNEEQKKRFREDMEFDFSFSQNGGGRFRVNLYQERFGPAIALRVISETIPSFGELGLSEAVERLMELPHGLVLVTGSAGMGKSTTLASMVDLLNERRRAHIITIEDPIEYVYKNKNCLITQREVNVHTRSFASAIRMALRQDPDVVMVGEMRDLETIAAAMTLAETGHLVLSTLHTPDAAQTVNRIIDVFPAYQQQQIRMQLANTLKGVISQVLIPRADGEGRIAAREILLTSDATRNCIASGQAHQLYSIIQIGMGEGMVPMDQSLEQLVRNGDVSKEEALSKASDMEMLASRLENI